MEFVSSQEVWYQKKTVSFHIRFIWQELNRILENLRDRIPLLETEEGGISGRFSHSVFRIT